MKILFSTFLHSQSDHANLAAGLFQHCENCLKKSIKSDTTSFMRCYHIGAIKTHKICTFTRSKAQICTTQPRVDNANKPWSGCMASKTHYFRYCYNWRGLWHVCQASQPGWSQEMHQDWHCDYQGTGSKEASKAAGGSLVARKFFRLKAAAQASQT